VTRAVAAVALALLVASGAVSAEPRVFKATGTIEVAFAPWDDAEGMVVRAIEAARKQILVQAFSFTSRPIAAALIAARARGVDVQVTADRDQTFAGEGSRIPELAVAGIPIWLEVRYQSAHNKVMVIDAGRASPAVVTGSANWTAAAARKNAENVVILRDDQRMARAYAANWRRHRSDALPYAAGPRPH
jgi:phosphatidylserine/phosphatidylglycerophosphate/cardiolipin synthase-like enzyme